MATVLRDEPAWLSERREAARRAFESLPAPYPDRTDLTGVDYGAYAEAADALPALAGEEPPEGVVFCPLDVAARDHADLVRPHLFGQVGPEHGKFAALNAAAWSGGAFLYVPPGAELTRPLEIVWPQPPAGATFAPHTLVVLGGGASATVLQSTAENAPAGEALISSAVEVVLGDGARLRFADLQNWGPEVTNLSARSGLLGRDAVLEWVVGEIGSRLTSGWTTTLLDGVGSEAHSYLVFFGSGQQHLDLSLTLLHRGARTNGEMVARGVLKDTARAIYRGTSDIKKGAKYSNSQQHENALHLTDGVRSDAIPSLYIDEHELSAGHAATVGKVDEEQLFYLKSRGLPEAEALRLIVHGFFAPLFERIPVERAREALGRLIDRKMEG